MCQRAGRDGRPTTWWGQPVSAAAWRPRSPASASALTDTAAVRRAADALPRSVLPRSVLPRSVLPRSVLPRSVLPDSASLFSCRENACRSPVPPGDRAGSRLTALNVCA